MIEAKINKSLKNDALSVCGSIYSMNAPYAIGYAFNPHMKDSGQVSTGEFIGEHDFIEPERLKQQYTYFFDYKDKKFYDLDSLKV